MDEVPHDYPRLKEPGRQVTSCHPLFVDFRLQNYLVDLATLEKSIVIMGLQLAWIGLGNMGRVESIIRHNFLAD